MSPSQLQAAYDFLAATAFVDIELPRRVLIRAKPLRKYDGCWWRDDKVIDLASSLSWAKLLPVLAHEMCHAAIDHADGDHEEHGPAFQALAHDVCKRMGWPLKGF